MLAGCLLEGSVRFDKLQVRAACGPKNKLCSPNYLASGVYNGICSPLGQRWGN